MIRSTAGACSTGAWHLGFIQWSGSLPDGEWGVKGTPGEQATADFHAEIARMAPLLDGMYAVRPRVGVFLAHPTWAFDGFLPQWDALHAAAIARHVPKCYVYDSQVVDGEAADYPVLVSVDNCLVVAGALGRGPGLPEPLRGRDGVTQLPDTDADTILDALGPEAGA